MIYKLYKYVKINVIIIEYNIELFGVYDFL